MRIIVCIKQVPDTTEVKIDPITNNLVREGVPSIMNPSDYCALVTALKIREKEGGTVTLLSMGPMQVEKELRRGLNMGADRAVLLCDRKLGGADTIATAYSLARAAQRIGFDLVLLGDEAIDGCTGQVGPMMGEYLNIPAFSNACHLEISKGLASVVRVTEKCTEEYEAPLPVIVCKRKDNDTVSEKNTDAQVEVWDASFLEEARIGSKGSPTRVSGISIFEKKRNYLQVAYNWDLETRMEYIFNGGLLVKDTPLLRGSSEEVATEILKEIVSEDLVCLK